MYIYIHLCSEAVLQRCSPRKMLYKHEANPQENNNAEESSQKNRFAIKITPTDRYAAQNLQHICRISSSASACQKILKYINY